MLGMFIAFVVGTGAGTWLSYWFMLGWVHQGVDRHEATVLRIQRENSLLRKQNAILREDYRARLDEEAQVWTSDA